MLKGEKMDGFGERLKKFRKKAGVKQGDLAEKLGISLRTYQNYEQSERTPSEARVKEIAEALGMSPLLLIGEENHDAELIYAAARLVKVFRKGHLTGAVKDAVLKSIQEEYWDSKRRTRALKIKDAEFQIQHMSELSLLNIRRQVDDDEEED